MDDQKAIVDMGGTMRLGAYPARLAAGSIVREAYGEEVVYERHRHRYELNNRYRQVLEDHGMVCSGSSPDGLLVEFVELPPEAPPLFAARGELDPAGSGEATVQDYVRHLSALRDDDGRPVLASSSIARALVAVRSFHGFCAEEGLLPTDPSEEVDAPRVPQGIPKALDEAQVELLLGAVTGDGPLPQRDRALLETLYATGIRISEAVGLELGDIDLDDGVVRVLGKGDKERIVPIGRSARRVVAA